jgi:hypothetical protein
MSEAWRLESRCSDQTFAVFVVVTEVKIRNCGLVGYDNG